MQNTREDAKYDVLNKITSCFKILLIISKILNKEVNDNLVYLNTLHFLMFMWNEAFQNIRTCGYIIATDLSLKTLENISLCDVLFK